MKPVVDAVLTELGAALARGEALVVQPLGKMSVARTRDRGGAEVLTIKLRRSKPAEATGEAQTEPAE